MEDEPNLPEGKEWFSLRELAAVVGRHKLTIYNWERAGLIPEAARRVPLGIQGKVEMREYSREQVIKIWKKRHHRAA